MPTGRTDATQESVTTVRGPWSLATSRRFWENFAPAALPVQQARAPLRARFVSEHDWTAVTAEVTQDGARARIRVAGRGDLDAAREQVRRFLSLDVDATGWPAVGVRDPVIADAQRAMPGFRPCGFHSPYEAAVWAVLSQRTRVPIAARMRARLIAEHGDDGALPPPGRLAELVTSARLDLPGRKAEYLSAVASAALDGLLESTYLRSLDEEVARAQLLGIQGVGPFATDLILVRGTHATDILPRAEPRLEQEVEHLYGSGSSLARVADAWRPFRSWASVHLRALAEGPRTVTPPRA